MAPAGIYQRTDKRHVKHAAPSNPNWSSGPAAATPFALQARTGPTEFEQLIVQLGTPERYWCDHPAIRKWVHLHKNHRYVPEFLLKELGERVIDDGDAI